MWKYCKLYIIFIILIILCFGLFIVIVWDYLFLLKFENSILGILIKYVCYEFFRVWFSVGFVMWLSFVFLFYRKFEGCY